MAAPTSMSYDRARSLLLLSGLIVVGLVAITMIVRGVDPVEVIATSFFAPIFVGLLFYGVRVGAALGVVAAAAYLGMRLPAIGLVGFRPLAGLIISRVSGFVAFGLIGGWAAERLQATLDKLELYDEIDDETGLGNARSVVHALDTERSRSNRYQSVFSVIVASFPAERWQSLGSRQRRARLQSLGSKLSDALRDSDHAAHVRDGTDHVLVLVLPETGHEGAETVAGNLRRRLELDGDRDLSATAFTHPGDEAAIDSLLERFRLLDAASRPVREIS